MVLTDYSWLLVIYLVIHGISGYGWFLVVSAGNCWLLVILAGYSWLLVVSASYSWLFAVLAGHSCFVGGLSWFC